MVPPSTITCVDCGGVAGLISFLPEDGEVEPGTILTYRCADCLERFDIVAEDTVESGELGGP